MGLGLPNVVVTSLALRQDQRDLIAATYGRSFFTLQVEDPTAVPGESADAVTASAALVGRTFAPFPNPAHGETRIQWDLPRAAPVRVEIVNVAGRRVLSRELGPAKAGRGWFDWDGRDARGHRMASGVYLVTVSAGNERLGSETIVLKR